MPFIEPITLAGRYATLEPLNAGHHDALVTAVCDGELWKLWYTAIPSPENMFSEIERRLDLQSKNSMFPFAIRRHDTGAICGMTTYMNIDAAHRHIEIG